MSGAEFRVVHVDLEGSGMAFFGHEGLTVVDAHRCCKNCTVIFGTIGRCTDFGPFIPGELEPLNEEARAIQAEIEADNT